MNILNNFVNPWESSGALGSQALGTEVLEGNVLESIDNTADLNPYRSYCFSEQGTLLGRFLFESPSGKVLIVGTATLAEIRKERGTKQNTKEAETFYIKALKNKAITIADFDTQNRISSEVFSIIYTHILESHGYDLSKIYNQKISTWGAGTKYEDYNEPEKMYYANTVHINENLFKLTLNIGQTLYDFCNVENVVNAMGAHEYEGHGMKKWSGNNGKNTHHKAFEYQMAHKSWQYTTMLFKADMTNKYLGTLQEELSLTDFWKKYDTIKKKYGKYKEFDSIWEFYNR